MMSQTCKLIILIYYSPKTLQNYKIIVIWRQNLPPKLGLFIEFIHLTIDYTILNKRQQHGTHHVALMTACTMHKRAPSLLYGNDGVVV